jgi:predicted metal-dependent RNase
MLYTEADLETSMDKIETINFHEEKDVFGIKFWAYNAGHVLGAAMFMIEIAGVKVLMTHNEVNLFAYYDAKNKIMSNKDFLASQLANMLCAIILSCQEL